MRRVDNEQQPTDRVPASNTIPSRPQETVVNQRDERNMQPPVTQAPAPQPSQQVVGAADNEGQLQSLQRQLQETQRQLQEARARLQAAKDRETQLRMARERQVQLQTTQKQLQDAQAQLQATLAELRETEARLSQFNQ